MADQAIDTTLTAASREALVVRAPDGAGRVAPLRIRDRERYEVIGEHGRGGLGRVSRAHDKELGRDVAIKELIAGGEVHELRFLREALITARLEHPGIVPIHEAGRWGDGTPFYAMKLVSGRPLKELIAERTTRDQRLGLLHHVIAVADAIAYAHGRRIIHRDLKPSNVIIGEFGETIVIDWGLAKDLSAADDVATGSDADAEVDEAPVGLDLTSAGAVVGTPAYMAPEQARGEQVDQRVDVYAIGAMLWELCVGTRRPPSESRVRRRLLRRAGIDRDLAAIIGKALARVPAERYRDAGALADDLKAFQAGARIAARDYSLLATLAHWTRRHRTLARSVVALAAVGLVATIAYVRNIAFERDRADASALVARAEQRRAEHTTAELTLKNAELQLRGDPTAALAILADYRGTDMVRARRLRAEAIGRGIATAVIHPHHNAIHFLQGDERGAIFSLSNDGTIRLTRGGETSVLARDVATPPVVGHAATARVMAYARAPAGVAVVSLRTYAITVIPEGNPQAIDVAPDGSRVVVLGVDGAIAVWRLAPTPAIVHLDRAAEASSVLFVTPERLVVIGNTTLRTIALDAPGRSETRTIAPQASDVDPERIAIGDARGHIALLSPRLELRAELSPCRLATTAVAVIPGSALIAFGCQEGSVGLARYDAATRALEVVDTFETAEQPFIIRPDPEGATIVVADDSHHVYVYDVAARLVRRYEGESPGVRFVAPRSPEFGGILVGDRKGTVRVWEPPPRGAKRVLSVPTIVFNAIFAPDGASLFANALDEVVREIRIADRAVTAYTGHGRWVSQITVAPDGQSMLSLDSTGAVRTWRPRGAALVERRELDVAGAGYIEGGRRVVSIGNDGRVLAWTPSGGEVAELFRGPQLVALELLAHNDHAIVRDAAGAIWDVPPAGTPRPVRAAGTTAVTTMRASPDGHRFAIGTETGIVVVYDTATWTPIATATIAGIVRQIRFDPHNRDLVILSEDARVKLVALGTARTVPWTELAMPARSAAYDPRGEVLAFTCSDGGTWFYDLRADRWGFTLDHWADTTSTAFSPDGTQFASADRRGNVTVRDVATAFASAGN